ncbi:MAG: PrsW family glutamic-type intramembrane protease [Candidatus Anstonellales archaeon]
MNILTAIEPKLMTYEEIENIANTLVLAGIIFVPLLSGISASSIILAFYEFLKLNCGSWKHLLRLFIPKEKLNSLRDIGTFLTSFLATVEVQVFMLFLIAFTLFRIFLILSTNYGQMILGILYLFAIPIAFAIPIILAAIFIIFIKPKTDLNIFVFCFIYGIFIAMITLYLNEMLQNLSDNNLTSIMKPLIISPIIEEFMKGILILVLATRKEFNSLKDFLLASLLLGFGFSAFENFLYFVAKISPYIYGLNYWTNLIIYRSIFNLIAHGLFTFYLAYFIYLFKNRQIELFHALVLGFFFAIITHSLFNFSAMIDIVSVNTYRIPFLFFNPLIVVILFLVFLWIIYHDSKNDLDDLHERKRRKQRLRKIFFISYR